MKNQILLYITIVSVFSFNCYAQKAKIDVVDKKSKTTQIKTQTKTELIPKLDKTVKSYHVEENINMKFGGYNTTYNVSDKSLVNTNDLGPNNTRVVTLRYSEEPQLPDYQKEIIKDTIKTVLSNNSNEIDNSKKQDDYAYVHMIKTYKKVVEKGYKSIDIFKKVGNSYYYNSEFEKAAKCYGELLAMTPDVESEYYYRYAHSLRTIGQNDKANKMLEKYNQLSGNNTRK